MQAIISNIMVNMFHASILCRKGSKLRPWILGGFGVVIACNLVLLLFFIFKKGEQLIVFH